MRAGTRITLAAVAALAAAALIGYAATRGHSRPAAPHASAPPVLEFAAEDLYTVEPVALERTLAITGTLTPLVEATLKAKVAGELEAVPVREGEAVARGQVVARIDRTELLARVAAREADVEAARAQLLWAAKNHATQKALLEKGFISQIAFDNVRSNYDVAAARLRAAEAELALARKSLGDATLVAPFAGVIAERHAKPGERVAVDARVLTLVDLSRMELEASVPATAIAEVRVGQPVRFRVDGFGEREFNGRIERINPATAPGSRSISVYAAVDNPDASLRKGMFAQGVLTLGRAERALVVPASAVREEAGTAYVYAIADGEVRRRKVKAAPPDAAGRVQVLEGLQAGERIVRNNLGALREGAAARLAGPRPDAAARR
ncbi:MAG: efflux RND transporter periplasmic adaptor subunit [Pseudomonadota bacterium]